MKEFGEFYKDFGLQSYPFDSYTTENELDKIKELFIEPMDYSFIKETFKSNKTLILLGNRGTGKTAILCDLIRKSSGDDELLINIEDYSAINEKASLLDYYTLIIRGIVENLFEQLIDKQKRIKKLEKEDKIFLSYLLYKYTNSVTQGILVEKIEEIQISPIRRFIKINLTQIRTILNYGATVVTNSISETITKHFSMLPPVNEEMIKDIFPQFELGVDKEFNKVDVSYNLINRICAIVRKLQFKKIVILLDKIDEDSRLANDAEKIGAFIKPLLTDNKLLLNQGLQLIISIWSVPFNMIVDEVRTQKHGSKELNWRNEDLVKALNRRISVFSNKQVNNYLELFDEDVTSEDLEGIIKLSNKNPRDLWHIFNRIFKAQYEIDSSKKKLSKQSLSRGINDFVTEFNFYEYYPRKSNARANSMDIYSYIKHLLKLDDYKFTKNKLNELAGTGSSTTQYVTGMEKIGLISRTAEKIGGGVVYQINDPKVIYAISNKVDISR